METAPVPTSSTALSPWQERYIARKAMFAFMGGEFRLYSRDEQLLFFVKQKAFKLKEELVVFGDEAKTRPMLRINARSILDVSATYDVTDANTGERVGSCKREGLKSMLRDEWTLLGPDEQPIAKLQEDSMLMALLRRFLLKNWLPQTFGIVGTDGSRLGELKQRFNPFRLTYDVNISRLDSRLGVAATVLILAIEGRQQ